MGDVKKKKLNFKRSVKLKELVKKVNERHGDHTVGIGVGSNTNVGKRLSTGSLSLDYAMGGGVPWGRTITLAGPESCGKTMNAYRIMGINQNICANCLRSVKDLKVKEYVDEETGEVDFFADASCDCFNKGLFEPRQYPEEKDKEYEERLKGYKNNSYEEFKVALIDIERDFGNDWAMSLGLDGRRLLRVCADSEEEALDIYEALIRTGSIDMICLDSIAMMAYADEIQKSAEEDKKVSKGALLFNSFCRTIQSATNSVSKEYGRIPTQIWINQPREKVNAGYGPKTFLPMGRGQLFASAMIIKFWTSNWSHEEQFKDLRKDFQFKMGDRVRINFKIDKSKTGPAKTEGSYVIWVKGPNKGKVDELDFIVAMATKFGEIEKVGSTKWRLGLVEYKTKSEMLEALVKKTEWNRVKRLLLKRMLGELDK